MQSAEKARTREEILKDGLTKEIGRITWWDGELNIGTLQYKNPTRVDFHISIKDFCRNQWEEVSYGRAVIFSAPPDQKPVGTRKPRVSKAEIVTTR